MRTNLLSSMICEARPCRRAATVTRRFFLISASAFERPCDPLRFAVGVTSAARVHSHLSGHRAALTLPRHSLAWRLLLNLAGRNFGTIIAAPITSAGRSRPVVL